jgi:hypothetical protein
MFIGPAASQCRGTIKLIWQKDQCLNELHMRCESRNTADIQRQWANLASGQSPYFRALTWFSLLYTMSLHSTAGSISLKCWHYWPDSMQVNTQSIYVTYVADWQVIFAEACQKNQYWRDCWFNVVVFRVPIKFNVRWMNWV